MRKEALLVFGMLAGAGCAAGPRERRSPVIVAEYRDEALAALDAARREALGEDLRDALAGVREPEFVAVSTWQRSTPHGMFETWVRLKPVRRGLVDRLTVRALTRGARVHDVTLEGPGMDTLFSSLRVSRDGSDYRESFRRIRAGDIEVKVTTDGDPGLIRIEISPLADELEI